MVSSVYWEWQLLIHTVEIGVKIAFIYDGFRIFRLIIPHKKLFVSMEDFFYWSYVTVLFFRFLQEQTDGILRGYSVMGMTLGMVFYNKLLGEKLYALFQKGICSGKRQLTALFKMLKIKLGKRKNSSKRDGREYGKKKTSKKKRTESFCTDISNVGCNSFDAGNSGE